MLFGTFQYCLTKLNSFILKGTSKYYFFGAVV